MIPFLFTQRIKSGLGLILLTFLLAASTVFAESKIVINESIAERTTLSCDAAFESEMVDINSPFVGSITLHNLSTGAYDHLSWDFGDGNFSSSSDNILDHAYANSGTYTVSLTIWNDAATCYSSIAKEINITVSNDVCDLSDCVWPGDANQDGKADSYDILHMGFGFGATGPARNGDPEEWSGQPAANWDLETPDGVNYKHLDTNGDGTINEFDMVPVVGHYSPMEETFNYTESDGPRVRLDFDVDTFIVDQATGDYANISAALIIGDADNPIENLHGLSLFLEYDTTLTELSSGISVAYNSNSFLGNMDEVLPYGRNIASTKQIDIGITKTNGTGSTGFGRVALVDFIIVVDIIDGRAENVVDFPITIKGIKAVDVDGNIINLSLDEQDATVVFIDDLSTDVDDALLNRKVNVYPNPAKKDIVTIALQDLNGSAVQFYNALGQLVKIAAITNSKTIISVADLPTGIYHLEVQTTEGIANKRLIVE